MIAICEPHRRLARPTGFMRELLVQLPIDAIETMEFMSRHSPYTGIDVDDVVDAVSERAGIGERLASLAVDYQEIVDNCRLRTWNGRIATISRESVYTLGEFIQSELESLDIYEFGQLNYYCENTFRNFLLLVRTRASLNNEL